MDLRMEMRSMHSSFDFAAAHADFEGSALFTIRTTHRQVSKINCYISNLLEFNAYKYAIYLFVFSEIWFANALRMSILAKEYPPRMNPPVEEAPPSCKS